MRAYHTTCEKPRRGPRQSVWKLKGANSITADTDEIPLYGYPGSRDEEVKKSFWHNKVLMRYLRPRASHRLILCRRYLLKCVSGAFDCRAEHERNRVGNQANILFFLIVTIYNNIIILIFSPIVVGRAIQRRFNTIGTRYIPIHILFCV